MIKKIIQTAVFFVAAAAVFGQSYSVEYLEGYVDVRRGGSWQELYIGDSVQSSDLISVEDGALLELSGPNGVVRLTKEGTYSIQDINRQKALQTDSGVDSLIGAKLKGILGGSSSHGVQISTAAGARGADAGSSDGIGWMESEVDEIIESGKLKIEAGDLDGAADLFLEAYDYAFDEEEEASALFYLAYTYDLMGKPEEAVEFVEEIYIDEADELYTDYFLLTGKLYLQLYQYEDAAKFLDSFDDTYASNLEKQTVFFLAGIAYDGLAEKQLADGMFRQAYALAPDSDIGKTSNRMLNQ